MFSSFTITIVSVVLSVPHLPVCPFSHFSALSRYRKKSQTQQILRRATGKSQSSTAFSFPNSVASMSSVSQYLLMWYSRTSISLSVSFTSCRSSALTVSSIFDCSMIVCCFFTIADRFSVHHTIVRLFQADSFCITAGVFLPCDVFIFVR